MATYDAFVLGAVIGERTERISLTLGPFAVAVRDPVMIAVGRPRWRSWSAAGWMWQSVRRARGRRAVARSHATSTGEGLAESASA